MIINLFDDVEKLNYQNLYKNNAHLKLFMVIMSENLDISSFY